MASDNFAFDINESVLSDTIHTHNSVPASVNPEYSNQENSMEDNSLPIQHTVKRVFANNRYQNTKSLNLEHHSYINTGSDISEDQEVKDIIHKNSENVAYLKKRGSRYANLPLECGNEDAIDGKIDVHNQICQLDSNMQDEIVNVGRFRKLDHD